MEGDLLESPKQENFIKKISLVSFILSIVFLATTIVFAVLFFASKAGNTEVDPIIPKESLIPIDGAVDGKIQAAAEINRTLNIQPSPYYKHLNFYDGDLPKTLHILPKFKTYQQTNPGTCGASASLMVLTYYNEKDITEDSLAKETLRYPKTTAVEIVNVFKNRNYETISSLDSEELHWKNNNDFYKDVKLDDDKFEVLLCSIAKKKDIIKSLYFLALYGAEKVPGFEFYKTNNFKMKFADVPKKDWCVDGEKLDSKVLTYEIKNINNVEVLLPKKNINKLFINKD